MVAALTALAADWPVGPAHSAEAGGPIDLRISNVRDSSFTVSWMSEAIEPGEVVWSANGAEPVAAADARGAGWPNPVHYVQVQGLLPATTNLFDVRSGETLHTNGGAHYTVTTGPTLPPSSPDSMYGRVMTESGQGAAEALVYIQLAGEGGPAALLSALIRPGERGYWLANLGNARAADGQAMLALAAQDSALLEGQAGRDQVAAAGATVAQLRDGASLLVLSAPAATAAPPARDDTTSGQSMAGGESGPVGTEAAANGGE